MSNPATALHDLLEQVVDYGSPSVDTVWAEVLGSAYGSETFALKYCEVVTLLRDTIRLLNALPATSRQRYTRYTDAWWTAVLSPTNAWNAKQAGSVITKDNLDHLANLGDLVEVRLAMTAAAPSKSGDLVGLKAACVEWLEFLDTATGIRQESRDVLRAQIEHLIWLIDTVNTFGVSRVVQEAQAVGAAVAITTAEVTDPQQQAAWRERGNRFLLKVAAFTVATDLLFLPALTSAVDVIEQVNRGIDVAAEIVDGPGEEDPGDTPPPAPTP